MNLPYDSADPLADPFDPYSKARFLDRHLVNWRWLAASALIGVVGAGLLGSSLYVSEGDQAAAQRPDKVAQAQAQRSEPAAGQPARKGDLLVQHGFSIGTTRHFRAPLTETTGEREITKVHALVHVSADLSPLPVSNPDIPSFDAARLMAGPGREAAAQEPIDPADADVSVTRRELAGLTIAADAAGLSDAAIEEQVAEVSRLSADTPQLPPDYSNQRILSRTLRMVGDPGNTDAEPGEAAPFSAIEVRIVPENVTDIPPASDERERFEDLDIVVGHGETLATALKANGATDARVAAILPPFGRRAKEVPEGQHVRLLIGPDASGRTIQRVTLFDETGPQQTVAADDHGRFVAVNQGGRGHDGANTDGDDEDDGSDDGNRATLYQSAYASALKSAVPTEIIDDFIHIFAAGLDLKQHVNTGDRLEMVFTDDEAAPSGHRELLYAALSTGGETQQVYRYVAPETGERDYLDDDGVSLRKLLMRKPVQDGRISSPFGMRRHPILHYSRLHNGVDWASPRGTPIMAAGDGTVVAAGLHSGYGNRVELEHANGYASAYNHMASINRQIKPGAHVHMGDILGFVGTTGLSTGPHVHYEVTTNGHFVDPMKVKLPSSRTLTGAALTEFRDHKKQIDELRHHGDTVTVAGQSVHPT